MDKLKDEQTEDLITMYVSYEAQQVKLLISTNLLK